MKNHVIPKLILKRFVDNDEHYWFYRKPTTGNTSAPKLLHYAKTFIRTDIYDSETESRLSHLEGKVDSLVNKIQHDESIRLNFQNRLALCEFLGIQLLRSERSIYQMTSDDYIDQYMRDSYKLIRPGREDFRAEVLKFICYMLNAGLRDWILPKTRIYGQLTLRDLHVISIPDKLPETFIIGDSIAMIYVRRPSAVHLEYPNLFVDPNVIKIMPVMPKFAITLCKDLKDLDVPLNLLVEAINRTLFNGSLSVAACKKEVIEALVNESDTRKTREETLEDSEYRYCLNG